LFYLSFSFKSPSFILLMLSNGPPSSIDDYEIHCCKFNYHTTTTDQVQLRWKVIVLLILMEFMIITVYKLSFHINQWQELVCWKYVFCWGSLYGICISCEVPSIADTTLGISEQYLFFCLEYLIFFSIDRSEARKRYEECVCQSCKQ
jgi:hypothetical protein